MRTGAQNRAIMRYWCSKTPEEERKAYAEMLALGCAPGYDETPEEAVALIERYGFAAPADILSVTRDIARGE